MKNSSAIWWVKRDMRLTDNDALSAAIAEHSKVIALFICEPSNYNSNDLSPMHVFAWWQALTALQTALRKIGTELYFGTGEAITVFEHLYQQHRFDALYSHEESGNGLSFERDKQVNRWCDARSINWIEKTQNGVVRGAVDKKND